VVIALTVLPAVTAPGVLLTTVCPALPDSIAHLVLTNKLVRLGTIARQVLHHSKHVLQEPSTPMLHLLLMLLVTHALQELS